MTPLLINFPNIDPIALQLGPLAIRWYALSYIAGFVLGWIYLRQLVGKPALWWADASKPQVATKLQVDDLLTWCILGVLIGGRLGHILFYALFFYPEYIFENPLRIFYVWEGGMSFHGGFIGVLAAVIIYCRRNKLDMVRIGDGLACATPFGLCFGRLANFINAEIWGKPTDVPWGVVFPNAEPLGVPRHPSQLYEAALEGVAIFLILFVLVYAFKMLRRPGAATGTFFILYAAARIFVEVMYRDSNNKLGGGWTMGIVLSIPMILAGLLFLWHAFQDKIGTMPLSKPLARLSTHDKPKSAPSKKKK